MKHKYLSGYVFDKVSQRTRILLDQSDNNSSGEREKLYGCQHFFIKCPQEMVTIPEPNELFPQDYTFLIFHFNTILPRVSSYPN